MTVELRQPRGTSKHVYTFDDNIQSTRRALYTVTASAKTPFPEKLVFANEAEMFRKVERMAEIYGYAIEWEFSDNNN